MANPTEPMQVYDHIVSTRYKGEEGARYWSRDRPYQVWRSLGAAVAAALHGESFWVEAGTYGEE